MTVRFPGEPAPPTQHDFAITITLPEPVPTVDPCACEIESIGLIDGDPLEGEVTVASPAIIAVYGRICPDTAYTMVADWSGEEGDPGVEQIGAAAFRVTAGDVSGTLILTPTVLCGGQSFDFPAIVLEVDATSGPCVASATAVDGWVEECFVFEGDCFAPEDVSGVTFTLDDVVGTFEPFGTIDCLTYPEDSGDPLPTDPGTYPGTMKITLTEGDVEIEFTLVVP